MGQCHSVPDEAPEPSHTRTKTPVDPKRKSGAKAVPAVSAVDKPSELQRPSGTKKRTSDASDQQRTERRRSNEKSSSSSPGEENKNVPRPSGRQSNDKKGGERRESTRKKVIIESPFSTVISGTPISSTPRSSSLDTSVTKDMDLSLAYEPQGAPVRNEYYPSPPSTEQQRELLLHQPSSDLDRFLHMSRSGGMRMDDNSRTNNSWAGLTCDSNLESDSFVIPEDLQDDQIWLGDVGFYPEDRVLPQEERQVDHCGDLLNKSHRRTSGGTATTFMTSSHEDSRVLPDIHYVYGTNDQGETSATTSIATGEQPTESPPVFVDC